MLRQTEVSGENFFLQRYNYLGDDYVEITKNIFLKPNLVIKNTFTADKLTALNYLYGPLGYIVVLSPFWVISSPDLAIVLLSKDEIFDISNHRIGFVISALFVSYIFMLNFIIKRTKDVKYLGKLNILITFVVLILTVYFSHRSQNPLYVSGKSLIETKLIQKVLAEDKGETAKQEIPGDVKMSQVPRNTTECLVTMTDIINSYNPNIYTGPDYLGAHSANRYVNALFPARHWDADLVIADMFETKTVGPLDGTGWTFNKANLKTMINSGRLTHLFSCNSVSAFVKGENIDSSKYTTVEELGETVPAILKTENLKIIMHKYNVPPQFTEGDAIEIFVTLDNGTFHDKTAFWKFVNVDNNDIKYTFVDYLSVSFPESLDVSKDKEIIHEIYHPRFSANMPKGEYKVYWGAGDLVRASEIYLGNVFIQ
jgi:hypothetical protein